MPTFPFTFPTAFADNYGDLVAALRPAMFSGEGVPIQLGPIAAALQSLIFSSGGEQGQDGSIAAALQRVSAALSGWLLEDGAVAAELQTAVAQLSGAMVPDGTAASDLQAALFNGFGASAAAAGEIVAATQPADASLNGDQTLSGTLGATTGHAWMSAGALYDPIGPATVMTLVGLGFGPTLVMNSMYQSFAVTNGNAAQKIDYPATTYSRITGLDMLHSALLASSGPVVVLGHSLGSQVASLWLRTYGASHAYLASRVKFILCGNPERKYGHPLWPVNGSNDLTPDDTAFPVWDVARYGDGWANFPRADNPFNPNGTNLQAIASAIIGMFTIHLLYFGVDLRALETDHIDKRVVGNTTYYLMP